MKLLFGIKSLDAAGGGAERVLAMVTDGLAQRGHEVAVLSFDAPGGSSFYPLHAGIRRICLGLGPTESPTGPKYFLRRLPAIRRVLQDEQPEVAIGFMHSMFVPMSLVAATLGLPMVASEHTVPEYYNGRRMEFALCAAGCLLSDRVTVLSEPVRALYPGYLRKRMIPVANPVDVGTNCVADTAGEDRRRKTVLSIGRLDEDKDHATLIEAFTDVARKFPDWDLKIVGEGRLRNQLETQIEQNHLEDRVFLPGTTADIACEYAAAQLFAVPSRVESFGLATAEALAAGLPVTGFTDCPGTRELVRDGINGRMIDPGKTKNRAAAMAEALAGLMSSTAVRRRLGENGRRSVDQFEPQVIFDKWEILLSDTAGGKSL